MKTFPLEGAERTPAHGDISPHAVKFGVATQFWQELISWPDEIVSLWLLVDNDWRHLDNPSIELRQAVQQAFIDYPDGSQEVCAYYHHRRIIGLYVKSKEIQT